jgi:hypothetical protein
MDKSIQSKDSIFCPDSKNSIGCLHIVLGCFGRTDDGFVSCSKCENKILRVSPDLELYHKMMDYFDNCRLFDRPMFEFNAIKNFLYQMRERYDQIYVGKRLWSEKQYHLFEKFVIEHRNCGLYLKLETNSQIDINQINTKQSNVNEDNKKTILKLIRNR